MRRTWLTAGRAVRSTARRIGPVGVVLGLAAVLVPGPSSATADGGDLAVLPPPGPDTGTGVGGGGGGRTLARPVAIIIMDAEGVRVEPVVDPTKIALAALTTAGFMTATLFGFFRPRRM